MRSGIGFVTCAEHETVTQLSGNDLGAANIIALAS